MPLPVVDPAHYETQLADKVRALTQDFAAFAPPPPELHRSAPQHYRLRAEFRIWHDGDRLDYVMFDPVAPDIPIRLEQFPAAAERINALMPKLRAELMVSPALRRKLFQVEFLTTLSGAALVTLVYHRPLDEHWRTAALTLRETLGVELIGRSRKQKIALHSDQVEEVLTVHGREYRYRQIEGSFTQPNGGINQQMLGWAADRARGLGGDLLELYCGNGNFTAVLAAQFERVLATEISKSSVQAARHNLQANGVGNVELVRMSSEEISDALAGTRPYRRLAHLDLQDYRFSTLLVDPPRAGLDEVTRRLAARFDNVLYISCNPHTQRADIAALADSHAVKALAVFDQFPYTHHLECGVLLQRR